MPRSVEYTNAFKKHLKKCRKRNNDMSLIQDFMTKIIDGEPLPASAREHWLVGNYVDHRECHIQGDWLLIYMIVDQDNNPVQFDDDETPLEEQTVIFVATGTHSDLFK